MSTVVDSLPLPPIYYSGGNKNYYRAEARGKWMPLNENSALKFIRSQGHNGAGGNGLSEEDNCLLRIQSEQSVDYVGPLAGYRAGPHEINGARILVTNSPRLIEPAPGEFPLLQTVLEGLFVDGAIDQRPYVLGWLKRAVESIYTQRWSPGQVLVLAGPVNSGKSLFQRIVTELLGGRAAKPYKFLTDRTQFNRDIFGAEHLMVEDEAESTRFDARRHFGAGIKSVAVNRDQQCHGKHQDGLVLTPIWRMTISLNNEAQRLQVLPPIEGDIADKIMLLKVNRRDMPMPTETAEDKELFWEAIKAELPHFIYFLQSWSIPAALVYPRFGVRYFHHPELLEALEKTAPQTRLLELVDQIIFAGPNGYGTEPFIGSADDLERQLRSNPDYRHSLDNLLNFSSACGTFLGNLAKKPDGRVSGKTVHGYTRWTIQPPPLVPPSTWSLGDVCLLQVERVVFVGL
jgi:hypothetical protein